MAARIRMAVPGDAAGVQAIYAPIVRDTVISFEYEPPSAHEMELRISSTLTRHPWLVCEHDGLVAGYAYAAQHRARAAYQWATDVSIYNAEAYRRRGLGRALYSALLLLLESQGFRQAGAGITLPNEASVGLHEAMGFRPVATYPDIGYKFGEWHPVGWWQRSLGEGGQTRPAPVVALPGMPPDVIGRCLAVGEALLRL